MKYIDTQKLKVLLSDLKENHKYYNGDFHDGVVFTVDEAEELIDSLQQEPIPDTNVLHTELVNLLKTYRIGEETARTIADRIADTYGAQRYMDGLCDGLDEEDTKQEQGSVAERFARIVRGNLIGIDKEVQQKFEQLYFEVTGNKMYGGYND